VSLLIRGAVLDGLPVGVRIVEGRFAAVGPEVGPEPGDEVLDGSGCAVSGGWVNGHTHAAMTLFRGFGDDLPLMEWLTTKIWPAEARLDDTDVYWGTRLACIEMIRGGTVRFWDMYWHSEAVARAVVDAGLRATVSAVVIDGGDPARGRAQHAALSDSIAALEAAGPLVTPSFGPHAVYTVSPETLSWLAEQAAARGISVQIHLSETEDEVHACVAAHGLRPAMLLDRCGVLNERAVLAHCVWLDDDELDLVAERGATIVTNPVSNLKLAVGGVFRYDAATTRGIPVGLGTDGASSNNSLDVLGDAKFLALIQKHAQRDPAAMPAPEALAVASGRRASRLGGGTGIVVGEPADCVLVRLDADELGPGDFTANLVYAAGRAAVDTVIVAGRVLMRGRVVDDADGVRAEAYARARRLGVG
jgi:5-methylthioadenosine/S-adenosylhomocysteine deaminase